MPKSLWLGSESRKIVARVVVEGDLILQTPAHFGSGDGDDLTDMPLLVDPLDGKIPLLTGASIAGALRSYVRSRERGCRKPLPQSTDTAAVKEERSSAAVKLLGGFRADDEGEQSPLIVDDALGKNFGIEMRDGVRLDGKTRTAADKAKFDLQLWQAGTTFPLRFELLICEDDNDKDYANKLKLALATALIGFNDGGITLGARKRRGYGRVQVPQWRVKTYDLMQSSRLLNWIERGDQPLDDVSSQSDIKTALGVAALLDDHRQAFCLNATFSLDGSLLIRSGSGQDDQGPDMVHLHSVRADSPRTADGKPGPLPILSGTSLGGALRARALKIANILGPEKASDLIETMFGKTDHASRVNIQEHVVQNVKTDLVQNCVSIDRFTGGARDTALFNEQPAFGDNATTIAMDLRLVNPQSYEIGLLLLLLKDLWTGDLPLGGESSVGRGRLKGKEATLVYQGAGAPLQWKIVENGKDLTITGDNRTALEDYVTALNVRLKGQ